MIVNGESSIAHELIFSVLYTITISKKNKHKK